MVKHSSVLSHATRCYRLKAHANRRNTIESHEDGLIPTVAAGCLNKLAGIMSALSSNATGESQDAGDGEDPQVIDEELKLHKGFNYLSVGTARVTKGPNLRKPRDADVDDFEPTPKPVPWTSEQVEKAFQSRKNRQSVADIGAPLESGRMQWVENQRARLNLWADNLGVFAGGRLSVEHRLRRNQEVYHVILQLLKALSSDIEACKAFFDSLKMVMLMLTF